MRKDTELLRKKMARSQSFGKNRRDAGMAVNGGTSARGWTSAWKGIEMWRPGLHGAKNMY